ncbi:cyclic nucleotide-binding protein [Rubrivivax gelatinosus]|uniref:cyclic nucleotide-binding domain-containing protein n=1 Tax=Rubrivivax gelatinosus TaxID=28068 RepID=UPI00190691C8|nr:cyclic nucleotide-binding domain-containing protein [Rubrivivax gelatinosus]MBK1612647.1 cyclic nucleotide-binding protein [Rubrivivax gelatinosus]
MSDAASWSQRAAQVGAVAHDAEDGLRRLAALWAGGRRPFDAESMARLAPYLGFVRVGAGKRLIVQDEPGEFMIVVLEGMVVVERQGAVANARLAEVRPGDVLGEMSLLDAGPRLSHCRTAEPCVLAVLETAQLLALMNDDAHLALLLLAALARRLSLRLRQTSTRLSALLGDA